LVKRSSLTGITALFGSIVQKGKFSAGTDCSDKRLNVLDFPTFGSPTKPTERDRTDRLHTRF